MSEVGYVVSWLGTDKTATLHFAIAAVITIALVGAASSYAARAVWATLTRIAWVFANSRSTGYASDAPCNPSR